MEIPNVSVQCRFFFFFNCNLSECKSKSKGSGIDCDHLEKQQLNYMMTGQWCLPLRSKIKENCVCITIAIPTSLPY